MRRLFVPIAILLALAACGSTLKGPVQTDALEQVSGGAGLDIVSARQAALDFVAAYAHDDGGAALLSVVDGPKLRAWVHWFDLQNATPDGQPMDSAIQIFNRVEQAQQNVTVTVDSVLPRGTGSSRSRSRWGASCSSSSSPFRAWSTPARPRSLLPQRRRWPRRVPRSPLPRQPLVDTKVRETVRLLVPLARHVLVSDARETSRELSNLGVQALQGGILHLESSG